MKIAPREVWTQQKRRSLHPKRVLKILEKGNKRFVKKKFLVQKNLKDQQLNAKNGQYPIAAVLSCIDSRTPTETIFDLGIGAIFNARIAGNFANIDILGSLEFAAGHDQGEGVKLILVLGHSECGAIHSAIQTFESHGNCDHANNPDNIFHLLENLYPAVLATDRPIDLNKYMGSYQKEVTKKNVYMTMDRIRRGSKILRDLETNGRIKICGGIFQMDTGKIEFLHETHLSKSS